MHLKGNNIGGDVYTSGYRSMYSSIIENVNNTLLAFGYQSLAYSTINNVYNLYIDGRYAFEGSTVTHVHNIKVNGTNSLSGSTIRTYLSNDGEENDNTFTMEIYSFLNESSVVVNCNSNDICYIGCFGINSCDTILLSCNSGPDSCFVYCDLNTTGCPIGSYSKWIRRTPTTYPSIFPSYLPSTPTQSPSNFPTVNPTTDPTIYPTTYPTINPSYPSLNPTTTTNATNLTRSDTKNKENSANSTSILILIVIVCSLCHFSLLLLDCFLLIFSKKI